MDSATTSPAAPPETETAAPDYVLQQIKALESDLDFAFQLQLQESIDASSFQLQTLELEDRNRLLSESETRKKNFARDFDCSTYSDWDNFWDDYGLSFGEGSSSSSSSSKDVDRSDISRVYFKSYVSDALIRSSNASVMGIGIAIFDSSDKLIFELGKPMPDSDRNHIGGDCLALIEAMNAALSMNLTTVSFYYDCFPLFQYIRGRWKPKQSKITVLVNQILLLRKKFAYIEEVIVTRKDLKHAYKLARGVVDSQINKPSDTTFENCVICFEDKPNTQFFQTNICSHRYCFSCMTKHVEAKLLHGIIPQCPDENCNSELKIGSCKVFLTDKLIEIMSQRIKEASIPPTEKVYCPFPKCSVLMSKKEVLENSRTTIVSCRQNAVRKCVKCRRVFCICCKVPWHKNTSCHAYKTNNPAANPEEVKLKRLADLKLWRQCKKCNNMIELADGCYHITCRCGYEFCYTCGAEWKDKRPTCSCPLWTVANLVNGGILD